LVIFIRITFYYYITQIENANLVAKNILWTEHWRRIFCVYVLYYIYICIYTAGNETTFQPAAYHSCICSSGRLLQADTADFHSNVRTVYTRLRQSISGISFFICATVNLVLKFYGITYSSLVHTLNWRFAMAL
jgi:hypothetical protein